MVYPDVTFGGTNFGTNAEKVEADLAEAGISIVLRPEDVGVALDRYRKGQESFAYWVWNPDVLDPADFLSFLPGGTVAADRVHWEEDMVDSEILDLIAQASVESNLEEREAIFEQLQSFTQENGPYAPFMVPVVQMVMRSDIDGYFWNPVLGLNIASCIKLNRNHEPTGLYFSSATFCNSTFAGDHGRILHHCPRNSCRSSHCESSPKCAQQPRTGRCLSGALGPG